MLIDFHTHFFPDNIALQTVSTLAKTANVSYHGDGTLNSLLKFMQRDNVSISINLPVATRAQQVKSINKKMVEINKMFWENFYSNNFSVLCFGSLHPELSAQELEEQVLFLKTHEVKGIKLHPDYQNFYPDEDRMYKIYDLCVKHGLIILFHSGVDLVIPTLKGSPQRFKQLLSIKGLKFILAHMGGYKMWQEVEKFLLGENVYFDLGYTTEMDEQQLKSMILLHGVDKILFGSDFPWKSAKEIKQKVLKLNLGKEIEHKIFYENAAKLLDLYLKIESSTNYGDL